MKPFSNPLHSFRIFLLATFMLCLGLPSKAQEENSLLWRVEDPESENTSYIFGTMHAIPQDAFYLPEELTEKIAEAELMLQEVDIDDIDQMEVMKLMMLPEGKTLKDYLSPERYEEFIETLEKLEFDENQIEYLATMKPIGSYGYVISAIFEEQVIPELELMKIAQKNDIPIEGLETIDYQVSLFDTIPLEEQMAIFYEDDFQKELHRLLKIYLKQDLEAMQELVQESKMGELETIFITTRNKNWVEKLIPLIPETSMFIAVGAGHLPGEHGLINLLREAGFKVSPVSIELKTE